MNTDDLTIGGMRNMKETAGVADQAAQMIKKMLFSGTYQRGNKLPGEIRLAEQLGIGRSSVREALRQLAAEGYVELIPNRGAFAAATCEEELPAHKTWIEINRDMAADLLDVRICIEPFAAELCAKNITEDGLLRLRQLLDAFDAAIPSADKELLSRLDLEFHRAILTESQNRYLLQMYEPLLDAFMEYSCNSTGETYASRDTHAEHFAVYNAIAVHSPLEARAAMQLHIAISQRRSGILRTGGSD